MQRATPLAKGTAIRRLFHPALGLQRRIMLYVAVGSVVILVVFSYAAHVSLDESTRIIFAERLHLAALVADEVEEWLDVDASGHPVIRSPDRVAAMLLLHATSPRVGTPDYHISLVDQAGNVLLATQPRPAKFNAEHQRLLAPYLAQAVPTVVVHQPGGAGTAHLVAYAPLPNLPGGILLEQSRDAALAVPRSLLGRFGTLGVVFLVVGLLMAWLTTRQVVTPLTQLTAITRRIALGDLSTPVPQEGQDEVRQLAASFEAMRYQLQESHAQLAEANRELEHRVQERTAELEVRHSELAAASRLLQQREAERTVLLQKTIQAQEEERRRVARELHDAVGQLLSAVVVRLSAMEGQAWAADVEHRRELAELRTLLSHTVGEVRRLIVDLRPELLDDMGLPAALGWYAEQMLGRQGVGVSLEVDSFERRLAPEVELVVFRVLQEAINNVVKHAQAHHVRVLLHRENGELVGVVADDGRGFEVAPRSAASRDAGVGLIGMRERVALLGGNLLIRSTPGQGTRLSFRIPVGEE